jgi:hypothetical protein
MEKHMETEVTHWVGMFRPAKVFRLVLPLWQKRVVTMSAKKSVCVLVAVALLALAANSTQAATITWGTATNIAAASDVSIEGTPVLAYAMGPTAGTVNDVVFTNFVPSSDVYNSPRTVGNVTLACSTNFYSYNGAQSGGIAAPYGTLISNAIMSLGGAQTITLTLGGLTDGQEYLVQAWANDARGDGVGRTTTLTAGNAVTLMQS